MGAGEWAMAELAADVVTAANPVLDGPLLDSLASSHRVVDEPRLDSAPAAAFRQCAVRLAREPPQTDEATEAARDAAKALLALAAGKDEAALRQFLRPDPHEMEATWTVACYQIGDLTPCALLDFASPVAAVANLAHCGEASHVAAELVASTPAGARWTALTRTGRSVRFQLPDRRSASDTTGEVLGERSLAAEHWRAQLTQWAASPSPSPQPVPPAVVMPAPGGTSDLERALELVLTTLKALEGQSRAAEQPPTEVLRRLDALDRRMSEFQAAVESALDRRIQALANYAAELTRAFAAQQSATIARLEARIDHLIAALPDVPADSWGVPDPGGEPAGA